MEIKVYQDTVTAGQVICDTKQELSVEAEILIPDYLPQVVKIVKCFVSCVSALCGTIPVGRGGQPVPRRT